LSDETRFVAAYKAIMQCAMLGLMAHGYRPSTTSPGHHQTMIQTLGLTLGVEQSVWVVLDSLRKKRNLNDYSGDLIEPPPYAHASRMHSNCLAKPANGFWRIGQTLADERSQPPYNQTSTVPAA
jgi:hypothetical protein